MSHIPYLPPALSRLWPLATNLRWTWHLPTQELFRDIHPGAWNDTAHNPIRQLSMVSPAYLEELAHDGDFTGRVNALADELDRYLVEDRWFQREFPGSKLQVAYFSPEFGISEALPQYSGGLGVLAGDHLKTASDLGLPLIGIGLFYEYGYFTQRLVWNRQEESYPSQNPAALGLERCGPEVSVTLGDDVVRVRIWLVRVGRTKLYLLDTAHEANNPALQSITDRLYGGDVKGMRRGGDHEHRLLQEIILGIGGVKALRSLGETVNVYHSNEGHAGFLGLERVRELVQDRAYTFADAVREVRQATVFTTHTPVPAGIDRFPRWLVDSYFGGMAADCGVSVEEIVALGHSPQDTPEHEFNMAYLGLRLAEHANGVSQLHGDVSRGMFAHLYDNNAKTTPIGSVTNGVHPQSWTPPAMQRVYSRHLGPDWFMAGQDVWQKVQQIPDDKLWWSRCEARENLVKFVREYTRRQLISVESNDTEWCRTMLDPKVLTIGFARRAASYKRLTLLLSQPERLERLLLDAKRPVQFVFAGKAHPRDQVGKDLIEQVTRFAFQHHVRHRLVFEPNYNIGIARALLDADVWLNHPQRPHEASGTSGMKSVYHGGLQLSVNDGWWDEMAQADINGWVIEEGANDTETANNLFELIEQKLVPAFYDRDSGGIPTEWIRLMKGSLSTLGHQVSSHRMVQDYVDGLYVPAYQKAKVLAR